MSAVRVERNGLFSILREIVETIDASQFMELRFLHWDNGVSRGGLKIGCDFSLRRWINLHGNGSHPARA